jgi:vacuolar-type H+-ATPase subunit I/STV1
MANSKVNIGKAKNVLSKAFVENNTSITPEEAEHLIAKAELKIKFLREEKAADDKLNAAKQIVKDLNEGYNSAIKYEKAKIDFLLGKIEEIESGEVNPTSSLSQAYP